MMWISLNILPENQESPFNLLAGKQMTLVLDFSSPVDSPADSRDVTLCSFCMRHGFEDRPG